MLEDMERRLEQARSGEAPMDLEELEALYTSGCAEILQLEADTVRTQRRVTQLRAELRHVRTAIEFLQEERAAGEATR